MTYYWMSFVDPNRECPRCPGKAEHLGCLVVESDSIENAVRKAWIIGQNPGGEIAIATPPDPNWQPPAGLPIDRLMSEEEARQW